MVKGDDARILVLDFPIFNLRLGSCLSYSWIIILASSSYFKKQVSIIKFAMNPNVTVPNVFKFCGGRWISVKRKKKRKRIILMLRKESKEGTYVKTQWFICVFSPRLVSTFNPYIFTGSTKSFNYSISSIHWLYSLNILRHIKIIQPIF